MTRYRDAELLQRIIDIVPGGIVEVSAQGLIRQANSQALDFLGMSWDALEQRFVVDWNGETLNEDGSVCPVEEYPVSRCLMTGEAQEPTTIGVRRPNGSVRWAVFTALPLPDDDGTGALVAFMDITERKAIEVRSRTQAQLLDTARLVTFDDHLAATATVIQEPLEALLTLTNSRFGFIASVDAEMSDPSELTVLATVDRDESEPPATGPRMAIDSLSARAIEQRVPVCIDSPGALGGAFRGRDPRCALVVPLLVGERVYGVLGLADAPQCYTEATSANLTPLTAAAADVLAAFAERRRRTRIESQLGHAERLASIGTLSAGVAHEINNPMAYVLLNVEAMGDQARLLEEHLASLEAKLTETLDEERATRLLAELSCSTERLNRHARDATEGAERVQRIVGDLMAFSRVGSDDTRLIDVNTSVEVASKMAHHEIKYRARFEKDLGDLEPVLGNDGRLSQVVLNLLVNAARAIEEGRPDANIVRVTTRMVGAEVEIVVEDSGKGIAADQIGRLFEPFYTTRAPGSGAGLGLSICRDVVAAHGGQIEVETKLGEGTRFVVVLPSAGAGGRASDVSAERKPVADTPAAARRRVLLVDDEPMVLAVLEKLMERRFDTMTAGSCADAIRSLCEHPEPDIVVCDMMMLDGTGMDVYEWLVEHRPRLRGRVIFATGGTFTPRAREFLENVAPYYLTKPFRIAELDTLITRVLEEA